QRGKKPGELPCCARVGAWRGKNLDRLFGHEGFCLEGRARDRRCPWRGRAHKPDSISRQSRLPVCARRNPGQSSKGGSRGRIVSRRDQTFPEQLRDRAKGRFPQASSTTGVRSETAIVQVTPRSWTGAGLFTLRGETASRVIRNPPGAKCSNSRLIERPTCSR